MEKRIEKWESLRLEAQEFLAQEFVAACEYYMDGIDPISGTNITSSTKFWLDSGTQGVIDGTDFEHSSTNQTDGAGWGPSESLVKAWWASSNNIGNAIYGAGDSTAKYAKFLEYQADGKAGYVDAVINPSNHHYHAGSIKFSKNNS